MNPIPIHRYRLDTDTDLNRLTGLPLTKRSHDGSQDNRNSKHCTGAEKLLTNCQKSSNQTKLPDLDSFFDISQPH